VSGRPPSSTSLRDWARTTARAALARLGSARGEARDGGDGMHHRCLRLER
jgi:hypothetical protein